MKKFSPILNGFKGSNVQEVQKGILNPSKLDNTKYAIFSNGQIQEYLKSVITKNEGMALEIQKSVVANVKEEMSHLIPVNIMHNGKAKKFYVAKADSCVELAKAMEPVNRKEGYFDSKINEDDILKFIDENEEVDDDMLIKEFGEDVTEVLNTLEEDGKLDVDEDGFYFVTDEIEKKSEEEEEEKKPEEEEEEEKKPEEEEEEEKIEEEEEKKPEEEEEKKPEEEEEEKKEEEIDNNGGGTQSLEEKLEEEEEKKPEEEEEEKIEEEEEEKQPGEEEEKIEEEEEKKPEEEEEEEIKEEEEIPEEGKEKSDMTPEELEAFAKKTATVTLLKFYKNSTDEKLKEIAAVELKRRGIDVNSENNNQSENGDLPENKAALDALEQFTKDYLGGYDKEDLISVVVELVNQDPAKRKELKDLYRSFYSSTNSGNKLLKVNEEEFKDFLTNHYFNNFTSGDLQSYAFLLISKNPREYRKYKKMMDLQNEPII